MTMTGLAKYWYKALRVKEKLVQRTALGVYIGGATALITYIVMQWLKR